MALALLPSSSAAAAAAADDDPKRKYDVFLSFRGEDTRKSFTDHLYAALVNKGIITFKDDLDFPKGKRIDDILEAIRESRFAVIVFSSGYASSTWCLKELETIYECLEQGKLNVFPIFYHVDPSEVRKQTGKYGEDLKKHEQVLGDSGMDEVQRWKAAMKEVASISGWHLQEEHEVEFIQKIVKEIRSQLSKFSHGSTSGIFQDYVGMESHLERMRSRLNIEEDDVRVIGICGMGGVGKSTIARAVHTVMASQFEGSSFLDNIRGVEEKHGLVHLQMQLLYDTVRESDIRIWYEHSGAEEIQNRLRCRRVLVVLDNVHHLRQLEFLAGNRNWFGEGSRIIITTRENHLFDNYQMDEIYEVEGLHPSEALQLFQKTAFPIGFPKDEYVELSYQFVRYAHGLPLAIKVLGSLVRGRSIDAWKDELCRLKETPDPDILAVLKLSFNDLNKDEKNIFLDIACFFVGEKLEYVSEVLKCCGFHCDIGMSVLIDKNLITVSSNKVGMHDLLRQMGKEIVLEEANGELGQRSRLWCPEDVHKILAKNTGTGKIKAIAIEQPKHEQVQKNLSRNALIKMENLRLLKLKNFHLPQDIEYPSSLRYIEWHRYPFKSLPSKFQPIKLVSLHLTHSNITQLWKGTQKIETLEILDLSHSKNLTKTPDFVGNPNLRKLILQGCEKLSKVHSSVGVLRRLVVLNLEGCKSLRVLPDSTCDLQSLEILNLSSCSKLHELPVRFGELTRLKVLDTGGTFQTQQPSAVSKLHLIKKFFQTRKSATGGSKSRCLLPWENPNPVTLRLRPLSTLSSLRELHISNLNAPEVTIPDELCCLPMLEELFLFGKNIRSIPQSIIQLSRLIYLAFYSRKLQSLPELPYGMTDLYLNGCTSLEALPANLSQLPDLEHVWLEFSTLLTRSLLEIPSSVMIRLCVNGSQAADCSPLDRFFKALNLALSRPNCSLAAVVPGGRIPGWFNYQYQLLGAESLPFKPVHLPSRWCNDDWIGFCICIAISVLCPIIYHFESYLYASNAPHKFLYLQHYVTELCTKEGNQLGFFFIPRGDFLESEHDWNTFTHFYLDPSHTYDHIVVVKNWGLRVAYKSDVEELIRCKEFPDHEKGLLHLESDKDCEHDCWCHSSPAYPLGNSFRFQLFK